MQSIFSHFSLFLVFKPIFLPFIMLFSTLILMPLTFLYTFNFLSHLLLNFLPTNMKSHSCRMPQSISSNKKKQEEEISFFFISRFIHSLTHFTYIFLYAYAFDATDAACYYFVVSSESQTSERKRRKRKFICL
jgi:hypothetical protein